MNEENNAEVNEEIKDSNLDETVETSESAPEDKERESKRVQRRIDRLSAKRYAAQEREAEVRKENESLKEKLSSFEERLEGIAPADPRPTSDDFEDYDDYIDKLTDWKIRQSAPPESKSEQKTEQKTEYTPEQQDLQDGFDDTVSQGRKKYSDWDEKVMAENVPITEQVLTQMIGMENMHDIAYQLASNPERAMEIAKMAPQDMEKALSQIEAGLQPNTNLSNAPPPMGEVNGSGASPGKVDVDKMSMDQYIAMRNKTAKR